MRIGGLFSGIGGLELGLEWSGLGHTVWQVEQSEFCRRVLERHWPDADRFTDVREVGAANLAPVDLICGGFPCQDISSAGKGAGLAGERSGLWFEFARIVAELRPQWVIVENVASGADRWVDHVRAGLGQLDYEALPVPLSARDVGAPHIRSRVFLLAHAKGNRSRRNGDERTPHAKDRKAQRGGVERLPRSGDSADAESVRRASIDDHSEEHRLLPAESSGRASDSLRASVRPWAPGPPVAPVCRVDDGIPDRVDRIRALGNGVVPQCAEVIGHIIQELGGV